MQALPLLIIVAGDEKVFAHEVIQLLLQKSNRFHVWFIAPCPVIA
jgi:hypothetical protein